jgi:hypothetical protein
MSGIRNADSKQLDRLVDFVVLSATFYASCMLLSVELGGGLFLQILAYSTILLVFVRLSKRAIASYNKSIGETTRQILGNATGILIGTCVVALLEKILLTRGDIIVVYILSGVMAFFILGTLSPIVNKTPIMHK